MRFIASIQTRSGARPSWAALLADRLAVPGVGRTVSGGWVLRGTWPFSSPEEERAAAERLRDHDRGEDASH